MRMIYKRREFEGTARRPPRDEEREGERGASTVEYPPHRVFLGFPQDSPSVLQLSSPEGDGIVKALLEPDRFPLGRLAASDPRDRHAGEQRDLRTGRIAKEEVKEVLRETRPSSCGHVESRRVCGPRMMQLHLVSSLRASAVRALSRV